MVQHTYYRCGMIYRQATVGLHLDALITMTLVEGVYNNAVEQSNELTKCHLYLT